MFNLIRAPSVPTFVLALAFAVIGLVGFGSPAHSQTVAATPAVASGDGGKRCLRCHDNAQAMTMLHTVHGQMGDSRTPFADQACETCHGRSDAHVSSTPKEGEKRALVDVVYGPNSPTPATKQNEVCLGCHQGGLRMNWAVSPHATSEVACATCHNLHSVRDAVLARQTQPEVCFTCHAEQRAQTYKRSHHPIREGLVACSDCHNPHGTFGSKLLAAATVNETCYQCHAEKRGPFLWEHAPVTDSCLNCHTPHGSSQPRLLTMRSPWLCQQCHTQGGHPGRFYTGAMFDAPTNSRITRLLGKGCLNCHTQVHGTNHPSGVLQLRR